ncbi:MAG: undecaprenyl-diphosphate phosphatase [Candidatus Methanofastidiosia archaeon]|jgi:undecaprenyl-diphosphatase
MNDFVFYVIIGMVQGILEWLPVSSSGNVTLLLVNITDISFSEAVKVSFFLHAGTMLSVVVKFKSEVWSLAKECIFMEWTPLAKFYVVATLFSAVTGIPLYVLLDVELPGYVGSLVIAGFLVVTGIVIRMQGTGLKQIEETTIFDAVIVGAAQGVSVIPGISRSGITISALLSRGITQNEALTLSFLLSIPPVLGVMVLGFSGFQWVYVIGLVVSFVCSLWVMEGLLRIAQTLDFSWFCFVIAVITVGLIVIFQV